MAYNIYFWFNIGQQQKKTTIMRWCSMEIERNHRETTTTEKKILSLMSGLLALPNRGQLHQQQKKKSV